MANRKVKRGSEKDLGSRENQPRQPHVRSKRTAMPPNQPMSGIVSWAQIRKVFDSLPIRIALLDLN
jgi:hypothetical protein